MHVCMPSCLSRVWLFLTLWSVACQPPLSMRFSRQEYWSGLPCPPLGDLPSRGSSLPPGIEPTSLLSPALAGGFNMQLSKWFMNIFSIEFACLNQIQIRSTLFNCLISGFKPLSFKSSFPICLSPFSLYFFGKETRCLSGRDSHSLGFGEYILEQTLTCSHLLCFL